MCKSALDAVKSCLWCHPGEPWNSYNAEQNCDGQNLKSHKQLLWDNLGIGYWSSTIKPFFVIVSS